MFLLFSIFITTNTYSEISAEDAIKTRKALFSKNYNTAKRVQSLSSNGEFDKAKELMIEMSKNYLDLLELFPENSKEGFKTEALPTIWENSDEFVTLMQKASYDMTELAKAIDTAEDLKAIQKKLMWSNCSACHNRFRAEH